MNENFFSHIPTEASGFISLAASALDQFLPVPSADGYLSAEQVSYLKAFFTGVSSGADAYLVGNPAKSYRAPRAPGQWFKTRVYTTRDPGAAAEVIDVSICPPPVTRALPEPTTYIVPYCPECEVKKKEQPVHRSYGLVNIHVEKK